MGRVLVIVVAALVGVVAGTVALFTGPKRTVQCTTAGWPDSMFGDTFGHLDGPTSTGCIVPSPLGWMIAVAIPIALVTIAYVVTRETRSSQRPSKST